MDYGYFFHKLDELLEEKKLEEAEKHLMENLKTSMEEEDTSALLTVMSELIGLYRVTGRHDESKLFADKSMAIAQGAGMDGTEGYATIVLNGATAYRAAGEYERAKELYAETERQLEKSGCKDGYRYASLHNNISLLYQETGREEEAIEELFKALKLIRTMPDCEVEEATTYVNLALVYIKTEQYDEAEEYLDKAMAIFERDKGNSFKDSHYGAALSARGDLLLKQGKAEEAVEVYEEALREISRSYGYTNSAYETTCENCIDACRAAGAGEKRAQYESLLSDIREGRIGKLSALALAKRYYEAYGRAMIREKFPEYENRIAVGLCGCGSECFGFDDAISADHDYGPAFCMWLTDEDYEKIGRSLQKCYDELPKRFMGMPPRAVTPEGRNRVGALRISDFFKEHTGYEKAPERTDLAAWNSLPEAGLATALNGEIFCDELGVFSAVRADFCEYYPEQLWYEKLAEAAARMGQYGQYNYERCMKRKEYVAALTAYTGFIRETMQLAFLIYREYMPYYKWSYRAFGEMAVKKEDPVLKEIFDKIGVLAKEDYHRAETVKEQIEDICVLMTQLLRQQGLSGERDCYMEKQAKAIMAYEASGRKKRGEQEAVNREKEQLVEQVVKAEWRMFQCVHNEGGRADCQNNWNTFKLMRTSQFMAWEEDMIISYRKDLYEGEKSGRNLVAEKYGRMMESTAPEQYAAIKESFPVISPERKAISEQVISIQVGWLEEFCAKYPKLSRQIRLIHTQEDTPYETSAETYLRGELCTYSENTFMLYCRYVVRLAREGKNLNRMIMENTVLQYGYASLEDAQERAI